MRNGAIGERRGRARRWRSSRGELHPVGAVPRPSACERCARSRPPSEEHETVASVAAGLREVGRGTACLARPGNTRPRWYLRGHGQSHPSQCATTNRTVGERSGRARRRARGRVELHPVAAVPRPSVVERQTPGPDTAEEDVLASRRVVGKGGAVTRGRARCGMQELPRSISEHPGVCEQPAWTLATEGDQDTCGRAGARRSRNWRCLCCHGSRARGKECWITDRRARRGR